MNIYDISSRAGVSIATVSRVLNQNPHVSAETRERVLRVIADSGYVPNAFARGLGLNTMRTIGLLSPDASDGYQAAALNYLESSFREQGYDCLLICSGTSLAARKAGVENLKGRHVDGMVLMGSSFVGERLEENIYLREAAEGMPVALLNGEFDAPGVYSALCDDEKAAREAVRHLIEGGKRRILHLYHAMNSSGRRKLRGYQAALKEAGISYDGALVRSVEKDRKSIDHVMEMLRDMEAEGTRFDAAFCSEDILAVGAVKYALSRGKRIPGDLAVVGYNNSLLCRCCEPEITSVDNQLRALCDHIVRTMTAALEGEAAQRSRTFAGRLVIRASTDGRAGSGLNTVKKHSQERKDGV